jgi:hypothetical protein
MGLYHRADQEERDGDFHPPDFLRASELPFPVSRDPAWEALKDLIECHMLWRLAR